MTVRSPMPRSIARVLANADNPAAMIAQINAGIEAFKAKHSGDVAAMQKAVDEINARLGIGSLGGPSSPDASMAGYDPNYSGLFASYFRHGEGDSELRAANREGFRKEIHAAMSGGSAGDGGYIAPVEWDRKILLKLANVSPMRRICKVISTGVRGYSTLWNNGSWGSGWVGETAVRPQTSTPTLSPITFTPGEIYAMPAITANLLDDADFNADEWLTTELSNEFTKQEGPAFIAGDGVNKPQGLLTYVVGGTAAAVHPGGSISVVPSGDAAKLLPDGLTDLVYKLPAPYRQGANWLMNSATAGVIRKFKDVGNNYIWNPSYELGQPSTLLGYPVEIDENMPDVAANAIPVVFGNFNLGYTINDRQGVRVLRDPYTNKPYVNFYSTKRVGGGLTDPNAFRAQKIAAS